MQKKSQRKNNSDSNENSDITKKCMNIDAIEWQRKCQYTAA